ncbi:MAG: PKD domain-containing protein, partial [Myxococcota bacterium]|nr:PKD domain-containing protein [Myxococcota bacterium]
MAAFLRFAGLAPFALAVGCMTTPEPTVKVDTNLRPEANAGDDQELETADVVELDGSASFDPDGDPIKYHWSFDHLPEVSTLPDMENAFPGNHTATATTWFSPDAVGTYVVQLVVEDDAGLESDPDFLIVTVNASEAPVADAGTDQEGTTGELFSLDGSNSYDSKGRDLTYSWTFATVPTTSAVTELTDGDSATPSFT